MERGDKRKIIIWVAMQMHEHRLMPVAVSSKAKTAPLRIMDDFSRSCNRRVTTGQMPLRAASSTMSESLVESRKALSSAGWTSSLLMKTLLLEPGTRGRDREVDHHLAGTVKNVGRLEQER